MRSWPAAIVAILAAALAACSNDDSGGPTAPVPTPKAALAHSNFADCDEYRDYYARALAQEILAGGCWGCFGGDSIGGAGGASSGGVVPEPLAFSQTNTQEAGVDEGDLIKADRDTGRFYVLDPFAPEVLTVNAVPAETMSVVSRQGLRGAAEEMHLDAAGDRLVLVFLKRSDEFPGGVSTQLEFYDVTDPDHPLLADRYEIEGHLLGTRRIGHRLHLVTGTWRGFPQFSEDFLDLVAQYRTARAERDSERAYRLATEIRARVAEAVRQLPIEELLPDWRQGLDPLAPTTPLSCTAVTGPQLAARPGLVTITSIDTDAGNLAQLAAVNNSWQIYASTGHLYLLQGSGGWWWDERQPQQTAIYRFRIRDEGPAQAAGYGVVDGLGSESFAVSEHEGYVRLATTETDGGWRADTHMFVLGESRGEPLEVVGHVRVVGDDLIRAVRFMGERGFVTTFWSDPLLTFDLSNPRAPRLASKLELPGLTTYLHPHGADQLIGVGYPVEDQLQLQQFDVTEPSVPRVLARLVIANENQFTWSSAAYYPQAFTLVGDLLSLPVNISWGPWSGTFNGFMVYRIAPAGGFVQMGQVDHKQPDAFNRPLRSLIVEENSGRTVLYTLSDDFLKADAVGETLTPIQSLPLR